MTVCRASRYKRRATGGRHHVHVKKRKFEMARPAAMTKLGGSKVKEVRTMGGNKKFRALKLETGNFSWGSETTTRKCRILDVGYNASNNELLRTKTLVKGAILMIDAGPFRAWYEQHYGMVVGKKRTKKADEDEEEEKDTKKSNHVVRKQEKRCKTRTLAKNLEDQFNAGRLYARVTSRPGQVGRCDG